MLLVHHDRAEARLEQMAAHPEPGVDDRAIAPVRFAQRQAVDRGLRRGAGGKHHPHGARGFQRSDERSERPADRRAFGGEFDAGAGIAIVDDAVMTGPHQPADDIRPHAPEANNPQLHRALLSDDRSMSRTDSSRVYRPDQDTKIT